MAACKGTESSKTCFQVQTLHSYQQTFTIRVGMVDSGSGSVTRFTLRVLVVVTGLCLVILAGCSFDADSPGPTSSRVDTPSLLVAEDFDFDNVKSIEEYFKEARYVEADMKNGEILANSCLACHTFGRGEKHGLGPNIHGFFGQPAARHMDFDYSGALRESGIVWTPEALEAWLALPSRFLPGTIMPFAGFKSETDRRDLVGFLMVETSNLLINNIN